MLNSRRSWFWLTLLGLASLVACSPRSTTRDGEAAETRTDLRSDSPAALLRRVLDHYRTAESYRDQARVRLEYDSPQGPIRQDTRLATAYLAPHSLRVMIQREENEFHLSSDGKQTWAWVRDSQSDNLRHQVVQRTAPPRWTVSELYAATELADPASPDQMLSLLMGLPLPLEYSPCGLIFGDSAWEELLADESQITDVTEATAADASDLAKNTRRIQVMSRDGRFVFWIDSQTRSIRRLELPTGRLFAHLAPEKRPRSMRLVIDWQQIEWEPVAHSASLFARSIQSDETLVRYFVLPPSEQSPVVPPTAVPTKAGESELTDKTILVPIPLEVTFNQFESSREWQGRVSVLVWFQDHPASHAVLPTIQKVYEQLGGEEADVVFRAVCSQPFDQLDPAKLIQLTKRFGLTIPVRRDPLAAGRDQLNIREAPTTVVLDGDFRLRLFEVGANPQLGDLLLATIQRLTQPGFSAATVGPSSDAPATDDARRADVESLFQRQLQMARLEPADAVPPTDLQTLPPARPFSRWKQEPLWHTKELAVPGNLLVDSTLGDRPAILVLDSAQNLVKLDDQGQVTSRHPLVPDEPQPITQWESARDTSGQTFYLGYTRLAPFVELFDGSFQRVARYPEKESNRDELVQDAELADLDRDGTLELYVAFDKNGGLHRADLAGRSVWQQHGMSSVYSVARFLENESGETAPRLLALGEQGLLVPLGVDGQMSKPLEVGARTFYSISTATSAQPHRARYLGLSYTLEGRPIAIGLNSVMNEIWSYGLPAGVHRSQVRPPAWTPGLKADVGIWWLAGADGSLHAIFDDGSEYDAALMGEPIHGFGADVADGALRVFVAMPSGVQAFRVTNQ